MHRSLHRWLVVSAALTVVTVQASPGRYLETDEFLAAVFAGEAPARESLTVSSQLRAEIEEILGHRFSLLRVRYWQVAGTTAWVLDEVGNTEPITIGVGISGGRVSAVRILEFRESRGWEVRHPFFTDQFDGAAMTAERTIDRSIDGITGATLSVAAVSKVVRLALFLDGRARRDGSSTESEKGS